MSITDGIDVEALFARAEKQSYSARRTLLTRGEAAQVADPVESPLWYVNYPESILKGRTSEEIEQMRKCAADVINWAATLD